MSGGNKTMEKSKSKGWFLGAVALIIACILQIIGLSRYVGRLPEDWVGIVIYTVTVVAFGLAAIGFFIQWKKEKQKEAK